jgi:hypothetical protein
LIDPSVTVALVGVGGGMVGYAVSNEVRRGKVQQRLSRIETKIDLIMDYFHLEPREDSRHGSD